MTCSPSSHPAHRRRCSILAVYLLAGLCAGTTLVRAEVAPRSQTPTQSTLSAGVESVDERRQAAVLAARRGQLEEARQRLEELYRRNPAHRAVRMDLAVVAAWAGDDARCVELLNDLDAATLPDYVLEAYAKAARNLQRWEQSLALYQRLHQRHPQRPEFPLARTLVLADAGRFDAAAAEQRRVHRTLTDDSPWRAESYFACGYIAARSQHLTAALDCYSRALDVQSDHGPARRGYVLTAAALGAARQALQAAAADPGLFTAAQRQRLELDAAAMHVRWAALPDAQQSRRHAAAALEAQAELLAQENLQDTTTPLGQTLRFDRIAALVADRRMREAVAEFETLQAQVAPLDQFPAYVLQAAARAYLYLRQPAQSAEAYRAALRQRPDNLDLQLGLFYALSDQNEHDAARDLAADMLAAQPAWESRQPGRWQANPGYARAREAAAMEIAYREHYSAALADFAQMLELAPANTSLRLSRASIRRWRGHYEAAHDDVARVRAQDPENLRARVLAGELALDRRRYAQADALLQDVVRQAADASATRELARRWTTHNRPEVTVQAQAGRSDGGAFSSRDWRLDGYYYSAPLAYRYRAFVHDTFSYGRFDEGSGRDHRLGAGLEYRLPAWILRGEIHQGLEDNDSPGLTARAEWYPDDHLSIAAGAGLNSRDMPLRGTRIGVQGDDLELAASYRWHENREASVSMGVLDMDDGNLRRRLQADFRIRVMNLPEHKLFANLRAYTSRNSETGRIYYNPESDRELSVGLTHEWRIFRHYDRGLTARLGVEAGSYWQENFGSGSIWTLFAEHQWQLGPRSSVSYGIRGGGRVYDGNREHMAALYLSVGWRP
ncbi:MAG: poly-beta-1,6 N-acetyl-D-glucosamine export porin PgaA [Gammaproteobacteria bacterium]|nr:poly-beta-1,6 N-acetyl-D-glucosamine export porin PgaA [Gammaproteobacteria bacterium]